MTRNITLAVDEEVLASVRRIAAERETTVNGLVREYLTRLAEQNNKAKTARSRLVELARRSNWEPERDWKWNREVLYDRQALRRHERTGLRGFGAKRRGGKKGEGT